MYQVYWQARSMGAKPRLLTFSETFPKAGGLEDGRIWIIDSSSGEINLRIQRLSGGWNLIHCASDEEAIIRLAEMIRED